MSPILASAVLVVAFQTVVVLAVGAVESSVTSAIIGGAFLTVNSILTVWLAHRIERQENERQEAQARQRAKRRRTKKKDSGTSVDHGHNRSDSADR